MLDIDAQMKEVMLALLQLPLLGRPHAPKGISYNRWILCYSLKFMLGDIFHFLAAALCAQSRGRKRDREVIANPLFRCSCRHCSVIWGLRLRFMFYGPSPCAFLCALLRRPAGDKETLETVPELWPVLLKLLNEVFDAKFELYTPQLLPCSWRHFVELAITYKSKDAALWKLMHDVSPGRRVAQEFYLAESTLILSTRHGLKALGLESTFTGWPAEVKRAVVKRVVWNDPHLSKDAVLKIASQLLTQHEQSVKRRRLSETAGAQS